MTIQKKSLISSLTAAKRANIATNVASSTPVVAKTVLAKNALAKNAFAKNALAKNALAKNAFAKKVL